MKVAGPILALLSVLVACLVFVLVWAGTERVRWERVAMDGDPVVADVERQLQSNMAAASSAEPIADFSSPAAAPAEAPAQPIGTNVVVWINVSGFRADYMDRTESQFLRSIINQNYYTTELHPPFPSLQYPSLMSQATGRGVREHGVLADKLRNPATGEIVDHPTDLSFLKAEPIWTTAKRQGVGVLVHHWPFSQKQPAEHAADSFVPELDFTSSAEERLKAVLEAWSAHKKEPKIRLVMVSLMDLDIAARSNGTKEQPTTDAVEKLDKALASFRDDLKAKWPSLRSSESDRLHLFITTDHGMVDVKRLINLGAALGDLAQRVDFAACDGVAQLWFKKPPEGTDLEKYQAEIDAELQSRIYWRVLNREQFPGAWNLGTGPQIGDRFITPKSGYAFTDKTGSDAVFDATETGGPLCGSGAAVADVPRMSGHAFFTTLDGQAGGSNLGSVDGTQLYPTVCLILGIQPAPGIKARPLPMR